MRWEMCHFWKGETLMEVWYQIEPSKVKRGEEIWRKIYGSEKPCQCPDKETLMEKIPKGGSR
jgi:hypothetical protein